jgi:polyphosphate kinase 2 (PPK2 family)
VKVHPEFLEAQRLPAPVVGKRLWDERYQDIRAFERHLARSGTVILKFFLNVSRDEQKKRFLERIEEPEKNWKFSAADVRERAHWAEYMDAYETMIRETSAPHAPWYVVPADNKWYTRVVVGGAIVDALERLDLEYPTLGTAQRAELAAARKSLAAEKK